MRRRLEVIASIALVVGGCGPAGSSVGASSIGSTVPASVASVGPEPSWAIVASSQPSPMPTAGPPATPTERPPRAEPPPASIAVEGGDPVVGQLGSYTWLGAGSDAPWLDGRPIRVGAGERLTLALTDAIRVERWTASRVVPGNRDGFGAVAMGQGAAAPVAFDAPPPGSWSVGVTVWFSGDRGSAAYYWLVDVR